MTWFRGRSVRVVCVILVVSFGMSGCRTATEPYTGRSQFILISRDQEAEMGLQAWQQVLGKEKKSTNTTHNAMVGRLGRRLSRVVDDGHARDWEFVVLESDQANAFCLPGGKIAVYSGLFKYVETEAELAAVVGHEIAHDTARHGAERMSQAMMVNLGAVGLALALGSKTEESQVRWMAAYAGLTSVGVLLPYSRKHEYAADHIGLMYMAKAGYDPRAALSFWARFSEGKGSSSIGEFLSTHPVGPKRIANIEQLMIRARILYEAAPQRYGQGERLK